MLTYQDSDGVVRSVELSNGALIDVEITEVILDAPMIGVDQGDVRRPERGGIRIEICGSQGVGSEPFLVMRGKG
jgi:hypothetical protein